MPKQQILLTICIASYNHCDILRNKLIDIFQLDCSDFNVLVVDNFSSEDSFELLKEIKDTRLSLIRNEVNIGAVPNYIKALESAGGEYLLFLTDKDHLNVSELPNLLNILERNKDIVAGYCELDLGKSRSNDIKLFKSKIHKLLNFAYLSKHPSGYIFKREMLHRINRFKWFANIGNVGYFPFEFMITELSLLGSTAIFSIPLIKTLELDSSNTDELSFSYSPHNKNLFFSPDFRLEMFRKYNVHLRKLEISWLSKEIIFQRLFFDTFFLSTIQYWKILDNKYIVRHYHLSYQKPTILDKLKDLLNYFTKLLDLKDISLFIKFSHFIIFSVLLFPVLCIKVISKLSILK